MSAASELMNKFKDEEQNAAAEAPVETTQPVETTEPVVENQPEPTPEEPKPEEAPKDEPKDEPSEPTEPTEPSEPSEPPKKEPKPDLSKLTKEQKAEHAFQRQLSKQKEKHAQEMEELKKSFQNQFDELKKSLTPKPEPEPMKTRDDFDNDTDFVNYLAMRGVDQRLAEKAEADAKALAEKEKADKEAAELENYKQELLTNFDNNAKREFGDKIDDFNNKLAVANANNLGGVLAEAPAVRDFIFTHPDGPLLLNEMLSNKESFVYVFSRGNNPEDARFACNVIANEARSRAKAAPVEPNQPPKVMPNLGKPGAGSAPSTAPDMWKDDRSLIDFVRRNR